VSGQQLTILFVSANPAATARLALDEEARLIERELRMAKYRDAFRIRTLWAARPLDLVRGLHDESPAVIHFAGHGKEGDGLVLVEDGSRELTVTGDHLSRLLDALPKAVVLVVLNACFSEEQCRQCVDSIGCAIGMSEPIGDVDALRFSETPSQDSRAMSVGVRVDPQRGAAEVSTSSTSRPRSGPRITSATRCSLRDRRCHRADPRARRADRA